MEQEFGNVDLVRLHQRIFAIACMIPDLCGQKTREKVQVCDNYAFRVFGDYVYLAEKPEDYPSLITKALAEDNSRLRTERMILAGIHTWENSVEKIYSAINKTLSN